MKKRDLEQQLQQCGWWLKRQGGSHEVWTNGEHTVTVPRHRKINEFTAKGILRKAETNPHKKVGGVMCIKFEGKMFKEGRYWAVYIPSLVIYTQGKSKKDALAMIKEAVELSVDRKGFSCIANPLPNNHFVLQGEKASDDRYLLATMLKNQRAKYGLSTREVAERLGLSKNAYAQYEQARSIPSIAKITAFIDAMSQRAHVVLDVIDDSEEGALVA